MSSWDGSHARWSRREVAREAPPCKYIQEASNSERKYSLMDTTRRQPPPVWLHIWLINFQTKSKHFFAKNNWQSLLIAVTKMI